MDVQTHWEKIYAEKTPNAVSWYRPHLETSVALIEQTASGRSANVIDVGSGESTLVDDLLVRGYENITVLDISQSAANGHAPRLSPIVSCSHRWMLSAMMPSLCTGSSVYIPHVGEFQGATPHAFWHNPAVYLLLLQG
jgi:hypothetical protein